MRGSSRIILHPLLWDKVEATPYGRGVTSTGEQIIRPLDERAVSLRKSQVHLD